MPESDMLPREYQDAIFNTARNKNTLVVLPTGLGKTLIALMLAKARLDEFKDSKILFLAPTRPLASQHKEYFEKLMPGLNSHIFTGKINPSKRFELWKEAQIIFSTPQCIANDLKSGLDLSKVSLLIEDECHRCLKNYDYVVVSKEYQKQAKNSRILGLTASPGNDAKIIKEICKNLDIEAVEIRTRESEDVRDYLQKLDTEIIHIDFPKELNEIRILLREIHTRKVEELKNRQLLYGPATKKNVLDLQKKLIRMISYGNKHFNLLKGASVCAQAIKIQHAIEMLETQSLASCYNYFQDLFEQAKQQKSKGVQMLVNSKEFSEAYSLILKNLGRVEHPKIEKIREIVEEELKKGKKRIIIFSQYRETVRTINTELGKKGIISKVFVGQLKKGGMGMDQREQHRILQEFKTGEINVLISTSIGEEGLDIPEVDLVIFYEPIPSAIRKIQRTGRTARLKPGKLIILITKRTMDESYHWASIYKERKMHDAIRDINDSLNIERARNKGKRKQKEIAEFL